MIKDRLIKKMISLVAATIIMGSTVTSLSGCENETIESDFEELLNGAHITIVKDDFIVVNGELHKGDVVAIQNGSSGLLGHVVECDCGQKITCGDGFLLMKQSQMM